MLLLLCLHFRKVHAIRHPERLCYNGDNRLIFLQCCSHFVLPDPASRSVLPDNPWPEQRANDLRKAGDRITVQFPGLRNNNFNSVLLGPSVFPNLPNGNILYRVAGYCECIHGRAGKYEWLGSHVLSHRQGTTYRVQGWQYRGRGGRGRARARTDIIR